ncbi:hypothetical protein OSB04_022647 [Centaurea solstitialis]|uniref:Uncharacterized protein n=1 Tax=Centaurea solstitialis TaxID=347529 RepID=A0AA38SY61_9ASTR|nr:hypothetical protein OSB04_022647 [Centaurea solstitialis]
MDGFRGTMFIGSGSFFKRQALLGSPSLVASSNIKKTKTTRVLGNKSIKSKIWGLGMVPWLRTCTRASNCNAKDGHPYSVIQKEQAFLGNSPMSLHDILNQSKRWFVGFLEMVYESPSCAMLCSLQCFAFFGYSRVIYAFLPQLALVNSSSIFPKTHNSYKAVYSKVQISVLFMKDIEAHLLINDLINEVSTLGFPYTRFFSSGHTRKTPRIHVGRRDVAQMVE